MGTRSRTARALSSGALLGGGVLASGCTLDFLLPVLPNLGRPAMFSLNVEVGGRDSVTWAVRGDLRPGTDSAGDVRNISSDTLRLNDLVFTALKGEEREAWRYDSRQVLSQSGFAPRRLHVQAPPMDPHSHSDPTVQWALPWRSTTPHLAIFRGEPLRLQLGGLGASPRPPPAFSQWRLTVRDRNGLRYEGEGTGLPPEQLTVGADAMEPVVGAAAAKLRVTQSAASGADSLGYLFNLSVIITVEWSVVVLDAVAN